VTAPDDLDDVPAGAAEGGFQLLDDLAVAADGAVEPLQVAVDYPDEVFQPLARRQRDGPERFRLVGLAVADEAPDFLLGRVAQAAVLQVAVEASLVDAHDRAEPHGDGGELPETGHEPGVRVRGQAVAGLPVSPRGRRVRGEGG